MRRTILAAAAAAVALATPAAAQVQLPPPADAGERAAMPAIGALLGGGPPSLADLDAMLARLPHQTPLRGVIQLVRAQVLEHADQLPAAALAGEEAVRLLPDLAAAKLVLARILIFTGEPRRAFDLWMAASEQSPDLARESGAYMVNALAGRLDDLGDHARSEALRRRAAAIALDDGSPVERSRAAMARLDEAMDGKDVAAAKAALTEVRNPEQLLELWVDARYQALWPALAGLGAPQFDGPRARWFVALRDRWQRRKDLLSATDYARLLASAGQYATIVKLFRPAVDEAKQSAEGRFDADLWFLAPVVARSLAETGAPEQGEALLTRLAQASDLAAMQLNASGNLANLAYLTRRWELAASGAARWLATAERLGGEVNTASKLTVAALRACALRQAGRPDDADPLVGELLLHQRANPQPVLTYETCAGDADAAGRLVTERFADEASRTWALRVVQPSIGVGQLPEEVAEHAVLDRVRRDPAVRAAAGKVGRIVAQPIADGLPAGFDPEGFSELAPRPGSI